MAGDEGLREAVETLTAMIESLRKSIDSLDMSVQILGDYFEAERLRREESASEGEPQ
jgi:hypothetical protein